MKRSISSKWTLPSKALNVVLAAISIYWVTKILINFGAPADDSFPGGPTLFMFLGLSWSALFLWVNSRLKFAAIDGENLVLSRMFIEKAIPLSEIENVRLTTIGFVLVEVRFKTKTHFGKKIFFMPTIEKSFILSLQRFHPIIAELRNLGHSAETRTGIEAAVKI
jgi:hypothetical protein